MIFKTKCITFKIRSITFSY